MKIRYRKLTADDLDVFIQMRINQLREEGATEDIDLAPALRNYYERHMADGTFVSWLEVDGEKIIGTSGMSFVECESDIKQCFIEESDLSKKGTDSSVTQ